jgi:NAD(P)-dependent dehydrogenase (short-subunit alcohol dehydrogenase family)
MAEQLFIVTGASRGMGAAIAEQLLAPGHVVLCISRKTSDTLGAKAKAVSAALEQWPQDLSNAVEAAARLGAWLRGLDGARFAGATLINNAGVVTTPGPLADGELAALSNAMRVGVEAPLLLTASFLAATAGWRAERRVLNISSGLGRRAMAGSAAYCAAKAGMDHFSRALALEGVKAVSLGPGVIDTDMQVQMRGADPNKFPDHHRFVGFKQQGQLATPAQAAANVLTYLRRSDFGANPVADVRDP